MAAPYLFPCVFEYSLTVAAILYMQFSKAMGRKRIAVDKPEADEPGEADANSWLPAEVGLDFKKSHSGLFLGVLFLVGVIISIILFFGKVRYSQADGKQVYYITDISASTILSVTVFVATFKLRRFSIDNVEYTLDDLLLIIGLIGSFLFDSFTFYASICMLVLGIPNEFYVLSIINSTTSFIQYVSQTIFIVDALRRYAGRKSLLRTRPGRSTITFLLIANVAMWLFKTFQLKDAEIESFPEKFFGFLPWTLMTHACLPIMMFYRFHSAVCLAEIWYAAYTKRKHS